MSWRDVRPIVVGVVRRGDELLVFEADDPATGETFYRPLGGAIEFDEGSEAALRREFREEIGAEVVDPEYHGLIENRFTFAGERRHELVLVYEAELADDAYYRRDEFTGHEGSIGGELHVVWKPVTAFGSGGATLYPDGIVDVIRGR